MLSEDSKILIVDDMKMIRSAIKNFLKKLGYQNFIEAGDGTEAVEKHNMERPDFIFMDIVMPNMTGDQALKKIRESDKDTPVVILTSVSEENLVKECEDLGITGFVLKPLNKDTGSQVLSSVLDKV